MSATIVLILRLLMTLSLYAFLGWALWFLWREIHKQGLILENKRVPRIAVLLRQENKEESRRHFSQAELVLGRDPGCDLPLLDDDTVSTKHAQLSYHHGQWWVEDLASTNGTLLNDVRVNMPTVLTTGDEIKCGNATILIDLPAGDTIPTNTKNN